MILVGTLLILQFSGIAGASDSFLTCEDFEKDKREDCEFVVGEKLNEDDEQAILSALLEDEDESKWETPEFNDIGLRTLTNKRTYKVGDTIEVEIFPKNIFVSLTYGSETINVRDKASFVADYSYNKIKAQYGNEGYTRIINVVETDRLILAGKIFFVGLFNYFMFSLTKSAFIVKWLGAV